MTLKGPLEKNELGSPFSNPLDGVGYDTERSFRNERWGLHFNCLDVQNDSSGAKDGEGYANSNPLDGNLAYLDLSGNQFSGSIPSAMGNLTSLEFLYLNSNSIDGKIPRSFNNLCNLRILQLSGNSISSWERLTRCLANSLETLDVSIHQLTRDLPNWLTNLSSLAYLDLSGNEFSGSIPSTMANLTSLEFLDLSYNSIGGRIPRSFNNLCNLRILQLEKNSISSWERLTGCLANSLETLDVGRNQLKESLQVWLGETSNFKTLKFLDLSDNLFSGFIPSSIGNLSSLQVLHLRGNKLGGYIPQSIGKLSNLRSFDIANNSFTFVITESLFTKVESLEYINLAHKNLIWKVNSQWLPPNISNINISSCLVGPKFPSWLQHHRNIFILYMSNSRELPSTMKKMKSLVVLDLAENKLSGVIPTWLGENLSSLRILSLHSNMIYGNIPPQISNNSSLQYLDLSHNNLSGAIPRSLGDFSAMTKIHDISDEIILPKGYRIEIRWDSILMILKGVELENSRTLGFYNVIDLSVNSLSGDIPEELTRLLGLVSLNLSSNYLKGNIPNKIGVLKQLESLDLSRNRLFGEVPSSLSTLNFLSKLNLSYNNLSGRIPSGFQLQTLNDSSIYIGNDNLCGPPLSPCPTNEVPPQTEMERKKNDESEMTGFFVSIGLGHGGSPIIDFVMTS
ncbi:receptor-like protein 46 [Aristolochia californica]|uniref:receptor-like protein 46 n=1 Tax=Aristolochia californica TaxID=171875 RepID=UPI0035D8DF9E